MDITPTDVSPPPTLDVTCPLPLDPVFANLKLGYTGVSAQGVPCHNENDSRKRPRVWWVGPGSSSGLGSWVMLPSNCTSP